MKTMYAAVALPASEQEWPLKRNTAPARDGLGVFFHFPLLPSFHPPGHLSHPNTFHKAYFKAAIPFSKFALQPFPYSLQVFDDLRLLGEKRSLFPFPSHVPTSQCWNDFHRAATPSSTWNLLFCSEATGNSRFPPWFGVWCLFGGPHMLWGLQVFLLVRSSLPAFQGRTDFPSGHLNQLIRDWHQMWWKYNKYTKKFINIKLTQC